VTELTEDVIRLMLIGFWGELAAMIRMARLYGLNPM